MASYGIVNFGSYCKDPCFVRLSQTMVSYTRQLIPHCIAGSFETDPYLGFSHDLEKIPKSIYSDDFSWKFVSFNRNEVLKMYSEDLYYPIIDSISELLKVMIKILTDAVKSVRDSDKCKIQTNI